jgi:hypothetical protein
MMGPLTLAPLVFALPLAAAPEAAARRHTLVVDFAAADADTNDGWFARALEQRLSEELSRFQRVSFVEKVDASRCPERRPQCLVRAYTGLADVLVFGRLADERLHYEVYETWTRTSAFRGSLGLGAGITSGRLQHLMGDIVRPIVQSGGLLDRKPPPAQPPSSERTAARPARARVLSLAIGIGAAFFLALPILIALLLVRPTRISKLPRPASWAYSVPLLAALSLLVVVPALAHAFPVTHQLSGELRRLLAHPAADLLGHLAGGALWAGFGLVTLGLLVPRLYGIGRVRHDSLWPLLRAWLLVAMIRALWLLGFVPVAVAALWLGRFFQLDRRTTLMLVAPACGLLAWFWLFSLADNLSLFIDKRLIKGAPSSANPWHRAARKYFLGYLRRLGIDLSPKLLDRVLFLPSKRLGQPRVCCYGGGFAAPRIAVNAGLLELALGPLPEETTPDERPVNPEELPLGIVLPERSDSPRPRASAEKMRREAARLPPRLRGFAPRLIGRNTTLLGWVMPAPKDETVPLISNTQDDYEVVHALLTEHYAAFAKGDDDDEYDDTDPTQKDFLFGAMLAEVGAARRHETIFATFSLAFTLWNPFGLRLVGRALGALYQRFASRPTALVADAYAALSFATHHLIQYLHYLRTRDESALTARGDATLLNRTSRDILDALAGEQPAGDDRQLFRATPRNRLVSLSRFFYTPIPEEHGRWFRRAAAIGAAAVACLLVAAAVAEAVHYHPTYVDRIEKMEQRLAESQSGGPDAGTP